MIKILGVEFNDNATMEEMMLEMQSRGLNPEMVPFHYAKARKEYTKDSQILSAQDIINELNHEVTTAESLVNELNL